MVSRGAAYEALFRRREARKDSRRRQRVRTSRVYRACSAKDHGVCRRPWSRARAPQRAHASVRACACEPTRARRARRRRQSAAVGRREQSARCAAARSIEACAAYAAPRAVRTIAHLPVSNVCPPPPFSHVAVCCRYAYPPAAMSDLPSVQQHLWYIYMRRKRCKHARAAAAASTIASPSLSAAVRRRVSRGRAPASRDARHMYACSQQATVPRAAARERYARAQIT